MDCFDRGGFPGKGILDVRALLDCCGGGVIPEGRVLSHDALEGAYLHGGFLGDVELTDTFPAAPLAWGARAHRWIRGDWQNAPWIFSRRGRALHPIDRFRLADNLRRSLVAPATWISIFLGCVLRWPGLRLAAYAALLALAQGLIRALGQPIVHPADTRVRYHSDVLHGLASAVAQTVLRLILLPWEAILNTSAIVTALWRMAVSHRNLLQWQTAAQRAGRRDGLGAYLARALAGERAGPAHGRPDAEPDGAGRRHRVGAQSLRAGGARRAERGRGSAAIARGAARAAGLGEGDVAVFRDVLHGRGSLPAAGQRAVPAADRHGAPHVADEHGARARVRPRRTRAGHRRQAGAGTGGADAHDHGAITPLERALLQLVSHVHAAADAAAVCVHGGQRQLRRRPAHGGERPARLGAGRARGAGADALRRHGLRPALRPAAAADAHRHRHRQRQVVGELLRSAGERGAADIGLLPWRGATCRASTGAPCRARRCRKTTTAAACRGRGRCSST